MKPVKSKAQIRAEIDSQIDSYLADGGEVVQCQPGESGRTDNNPLSKPPLLEKNSQTRTPLLSEIQAIEARRQHRKPHKASRKPTRKQEEKKSLLVDDFGEPLRWISK